jgi:hypothetical protein
MKIEVQAVLGKKQNDQSTKGWRHDLSETAPASQAQIPEFKSQYHWKKFLIN